MCLDGARDHLHMTTRGLLLLLVAGVFVASAAAQVAQHHGTGACNKIVRVSCFYDTRLSVFAGLSLETSTASVHNVCRQTSASTVISVPGNTGIQSVAVTSQKYSRRVVRMEFRTSDGQRHVCTPPRTASYSSSSVSAEKGHRKLLQSAVVVDPLSSHSSTTDIWAASNDTQTVVIELDSAEAAAQLSAMVPPGTEASQQTPDSQQTQALGPTYSSSSSIGAVSMSGQSASGRVMWLGGLDGGCMRTGRGGWKTVLTAPLTACWVEAGTEPPANNQARFFWVQSSTVSLATVTGVRFDTEGQLVGGRITAGSVTSGLTSNGMYLSGGTVRAGRVTSATVSGGTITGTTLQGATLLSSTLRAVTVADPELGPVPSPSPDSPSPPPPAPSPSPPATPSPSPSPQTPSPSPSPPSPSPNPPSPSPQPPSPSPQPPVPSPTPSPSPRPPSPSPSPSPSPVPSPRPLYSPSPSPAPATPSPSPSGDGATLAVSLFARGQTACAPLPDTAAASLTSYLSSQLVMLQFPGFSLSLKPGGCQCATDPMQQSVPQWTCAYTLSKPSSTSSMVAAVADYLAKTVTAGGQEFCAAQPSPSGFCDATLGITGLCARQPSAAGNSSSTSFCQLMPLTPTSSNLMMTTLASPGIDCPASGKVMSADAQSSLLQFLSGFVPGFTLTLPQGNRALQCVQEFGNAYYAVPVRVAPKTMLDSWGASDFVIQRLFSNQLVPCINATGSATAPAFCTEFSSPAMCGRTTYAFAADGSNIPQCTGAGSSMVLNVLNPETCVAGVPPPQYAADLTTWLQQNMDIVAGSKWKGTKAAATQSDATQKPTKLSGVDNCKYVYRVWVTGSPTTSPQQLTDLGISMLGNALGLNSAYNDVTCAANNQALAFCSYWSKAKMCAAYPWSQLQPYSCDFE